MYFATQKTFLFSQIVLSLNPLEILIFREVCLAFMNLVDKGILRDRGPIEDMRRRCEAMNSFAQPSIM